METALTGGMALGKVHFFFRLVNMQPADPPMVANPARDWSDETSTARHITPTMPKYSQSLKAHRQPWARAIGWGNPEEAKERKK